MVNGLTCTNHYVILFFNVRSNFCDTTSCTPVCGSVVRNLSILLLCLLAGSNDCLSVHLSAYLFLYLSACEYVDLAVCLFVRLSASFGLACSGIHNVFSRFERRERMIRDNAVSNSAVISLASWKTSLSSPNSSTLISLASRKRSDWFTVQVFCAVRCTLLTFLNLL